MAESTEEADAVRNVGKRAVTPTALSSKRTRLGNDDVAPLAPGEVRPPTGEVRFEDPNAAQQALQLSGGVFQGKGGGSSSITISMDDRNQDGTRIYVHNLPHETEWQEVKDYFAHCGRIAYAGVIGGKGSGPAIAEVRYENPAHAQLAISLFNGKVVDGYELQVKQHAKSKDGAKLQVFGLPPDTEWQELKDWFAQAGTIIFVDIVTKEKLPRGAERIGEVRYDNPSHAQQALSKLNGSLLGGREIKVDFDMTSPDGSKLEVRNIPIGIEWQELKDHFQSIGPVAYSQVRTIGQNGEILQLGKGKGKHKGAPTLIYPTNFHGGFRGAQQPSYPMVYDGGGMESWSPVYLGPGKGVPSYGYASSDMRYMDGGYAAEASMGKAMSPRGYFGGDAGGYYGGNVGGSFTSAYAGCWAGGAVGETKRGEVKFDEAETAQYACDTINGTELNGFPIEVRKDMLCHDGTRVLIFGLSPRTSWQDLKDHFKVCGNVAFADIKGEKGGKGKRFSPK